MSHRALVLIYFFTGECHGEESLAGNFLAAAATLAAQVTAPEPTPAAQGVKPPTPVVAGIPANYDEAEVGSYTLADPLLLNNGQRVRDAKTWYVKRRPELLQMFEQLQYGHSPGRPAGERFEVVDKGTPALGGKAIRKQVRIYFSREPGWPAIDVLIYLPAAAKKPVPMFLSISFGANSNAAKDPGILARTVWDVKKMTPGKNERIPAPTTPSFAPINIDALLDAGFGVATFYYGDVDPDSANGFAEGIRSHYSEDWGSVAAWAWGMSHVQDYFETDSSVDAKRVAIHGVSRLGKAVMWAGASDTRFAAVIASCSGEGGAALSHRDYGETIAHLMAPSRYPYWFTKNYAQFAGYPDKAPMDAHLLIALIAPRPLLLQTGSTDYWSDPKGEFLAAVAAGPVYQLLGKDALDTTTWPAAQQPILHDLAYSMHDGGHGIVAWDWPIYIEFLRMHLHPEM